MSGLVRRIAVTVGIVALGLIASAPAPTWADPTTQASCAEVSPPPGSEVWIFEVRGPALSPVVELIAVTADFRTPAGDQMVALSAGRSGPTAEPTRTDVPGGWLEGDRAWVVTPAGWQLPSATADVTVSGGEFALVASCAAAGLAPPLAPEKPEKPERAPATTKPTSTVEAAARATLPTTGSDVAGMLALGGGMVLGGILLLTVRRRRTTVAAGPEPDDDIRRAVVVTWHD